MADGGIGNPGQQQKSQRTNRRRVRRIIAEDNEWSLSVVPTLRECVLKAIISNFSEHPFYEELNTHDQTYVANHLSTEAPISATANCITDESYWKRCCRLRWPTGDPANHGKSWKRMYFEKHVGEYLEAHVPSSPDDAEKITRMREVLTLCSNHIEDLNLRQLLPPLNTVPEPKHRRRRARQTVPVIAPAPGSEGGSDGPAATRQEQTAKEESDSDGEEAVPDDFKVDHFDIGIALKHLPKLRKLSVVYQVRNVGMNFDWSLFQFTRRDCTFLARGLEKCSNLVELRITKSCLDDYRARVLYKYLKSHTGLKVLDLSFNKIGDRGVKALAKLLHFTSPVPLEKLILADNLIGEEGGLYLGPILQQNKTLTHLSMRLNNIYDRGCEALFVALKRNKCLSHLCLSACSLTIESTTCISGILEKNASLCELDVSCNRFGVDGGKVLYEGLTANANLTVLDLRLCEVGQEYEYQISQILKRNMEDQGILPTL